MENRKKVVIFCEYFGNGGIEKIVSYINKNVNKKKYDIQIVCTIKNTQIYKDEVKSISKFKIRNPIYRFFKTIINIKKIVKDADILHLNIHSSIGLIYAFLLRKNVNKVIIHAHNSNFDNNIFKIKSVISTIIKNIFCNNNYTYIACSESAAQFCFSKRTKYTIIDNKIDCKDFIFDKDKREEMRQKYDIKQNEIIIGNIGRFEKQKNHKFLIEIFAKFLEKQPNSKLFLVGFGKETKKIKALINKKQISEKVTIIEYSNNIHELYQMFDFYLSTSKYEGYGITIYEALNSSLICFISKNIAQNFCKYDNLVPISLESNTREWVEKMESYIGYKRKKIESLNQSNYINIIEEMYN